MKTRYTTLDLMASVADLQPLLGMRVQNVYDIDNKTYLLKLGKPDHKAVVVLESGARIHSTEFDWTKSPTPNGFSMKLRKHIRQKRLDSVTQLGVDRIVDLQFGDEERACHVLVELYDRGNVLLTDHDYNILNLLRWRSDKDKDVRFAVGQKYPCELARQSVELPGPDEITGWFGKAKPGDNFRRILVPNTLYSAPLIEHCALLEGLAENARFGHEIRLPDDLPRVQSMIERAHNIFMQFKCNACAKPEGATATKGYIKVKMERKLNKDTNAWEPFESYQEFHPFQFEQFVRTHCTEDLKLKEYPTFCAAVDEFFSARETQKLDLKVMQQQKQVEKKLVNIKTDHEQRISALQAQQEEDNRKAALIELNSDFVDKAVTVLRSAVANGLSWTQIQELISEATLRGDPVASAIKKLKLEVGMFTMRLTDPYGDGAEEASSSGGRGRDQAVLVDIDVQLGAYQNARMYYEHRRTAAAKQTKTVVASGKAIKSAEIKAQEQLKQVHIKAAVTRQRKTYWFEKFLWFVSSDNYLVVGGRDAQQNEMLVKRFLLPGDAYVHADLRGAASVIVKNVAGAVSAESIPPRTMQEAATMAVCHSAAWEAKVVAGAWWVAHEQVTRTAPSGEYLSAGSFMIRGKKRYLPTVQLVMGFGFLFRLDDDDVPHHKGERRPIKANADNEMELADDAVKDEEDDELELSEDEPEQANKENDQDEAFPDVQAPVANPILRQLGLGSTEDSEEITILQLGPSRATYQQQPRSDGQQPNSTQQHQSATDKQQPNSQTQQQQQQAKRGQKHKLKKMKEKYADQDEEERQMRIQLLAADGDKKPDKRQARGKGKHKTKNGPPPAAASRPQKQEQQQQPAVVDKEEPPQDKAKAEADGENIGAESLKAEQDTKPVTADVPPQPECSRPPPAAADDEEAEEPDDDGAKPEDELQATLDSLTGRPLDTDTLLYAVPVCAPYSTLNDYKFKVKLTPGTGKRGKATKTALQVFTRLGTPLQRDLLKATNEQDLARGLPGKVKVHAPNMQTVIQAGKARLKASNNHAQQVQLLNL